MKSFWGLIPRYILKNKKRIFFMAVGIVLSIFLIISASILVDSIKSEYYKTVVDQTGGTYDILLFTWNDSRLEELKKDSLVNKATFVTPLGKCEIPNSSYTIDIGGYEDNVTELLNFKLLQGRYPNSNNEIAVEKWVIEALPQKYEIGDKISLPTKLEVMMPNGIKTLENSNEFTLVGLFDHKSTAYGHKSVGKAYVTKEFAESIIKDKQVQYSGYLSFKPKQSIQEGLVQLVSTNSYSQINFMPNSIKSFMILGQKILDFACAVLFVIVGIVASIIIYNIFNVSVAERTKEFGILRALGASQQRVKALVLGEGIMMGLIFIPVGILLGNFIISLIISTIIGNGEVTSIFNAPKSGIITAIVVGFITIIIGIYFPARKASTISPIEAIVSNNNLSLKGRKIKNRLQAKNKFYKDSSFTTRMARLNLNRNRKKFITTVISLSVSIMMFMTVNYLINLANPVNRYKNNFDGDFTILADSNDISLGISIEEINKISEIKGVDKVFKKKNINTSIEVKKENLTRQGIDYVEAEGRSNNYTNQLISQGRYRFITGIVGFDSKELMNLQDKLLDGKIDIDEMQEKPLIILAQNLNNYDFTTLKVGDIIRIGCPKYNEKGKQVGYSNEDFIIGGLLKEEAIKSIGGAEKQRIIISNETAEKYMGVKNFQEVKITLNNKANYEEVEKSIKDNLKLNRGAKIASFNEELEKVKKTNFQLSLILYSFIFIVATISIINLINIMSMNAILRSKEIGMMRALGLGNDEVRKIIIHEGLLYGIASGGIGITLGTILTYLIYIVGAQIISQGLVWKFPTVTIVITYLTVIIICLISSMIPSRSLYKSSIIDSIRSTE